MKILFAADGSEYTAKAARYLATHFGIFKEEALELHLLHVHLPIPQGMALVQAQRILGQEAVDRYYQEESQAALAPAEKILRHRNIPFVATYRVGDIAHEICAYAASQKMDMIIMGSHGHGALGNLLTGSVTAKVLAAAADIPLLIVR